VYQVGINKGAPVG